MRSETQGDGRGPRRFALIAGELSGDILGAALIHALKARFPQARFYGVAGPRMIAAGCEAIASIDELSVMGLVEVVKVLPRILRLRASLLQRFSADRPDAVIGIDAPDFNLGLERKLRVQGIRTVHVVSPTVWAWREGRVRNIARAVDLMLCLFPFEPKFYAAHDVRAAYVGHPLADQIDDSVTPAQARRALGLDEAGPVVAILPGSRGGELKYLAEIFARTAAWLHGRMPGVRFITPIAKPQLRARMQQAIAAHAPQAQWTLLDGQSREAMRAADVVLLASGTATLECLLLGRPMVVSYRASALTAMIVRRLLKVGQVSLPNLLAGRPDIVPELLQEDATPEWLGQELYCLLNNPWLRQRQTGQFDAVRAELRRDSAALSAAAIAGLLDAGG
ncbi:MAG TPA: lipid-A-disaccharide synthase, partial [Stenotrophobium sp.]|nr:lipid-A-disaccharide synthase [Stenotrophobium sp.]